MEGKKQVGRKELQVCVNSSKKKSSMTEGPHIRKRQTVEAIQDLSEVLTKPL
jgi:hypothetical protein